MNTLEAKKALLSCPGDTIQETIDTIGMSQAELAERMGRSIPKLNDLINGRAPIKKDTAKRLEYVLGIPASFWLNLEQLYQQELLEIEQLEYLNTCREWLRSFPLALLKKFGILPITTNTGELAEALLKFFRVASPEEWSNIYEGTSVAFKIELKHTQEPQAISVWLRIGEIQANNLVTAIFDKKRVRDRLYDIQHIAYNKPDNWLDQLQAVCADCGIALVYTPSIAKAPIYGATRWINNGRLPLIQITDRRKDYNAFWFTFYHELAHILYDGRKDIFIDGLDSIQPDPEKEERADSFASRMLLSQKERTILSKYDSFDEQLILQLSKKFQKHPAIIIAQLQREVDAKIKYNDARLNKLKVKVQFDQIAL